MKNDLFSWLYRFGITICFLVLSESMSMNNKLILYCIQRREIVWTWNIYLLGWCYVSLRSEISLFQTPSCSDNVIAMVLLRWLYFGSFFAIDFSICAKKKKDNVFALIVYLKSNVMLLLHDLPRISRLIQHPLFFRLFVIQCNMLS